MNRHAGRRLLVVLMVTALGLVASGLWWLFGEVRQHVRQQPSQATPDRVLPGLGESAPAQAARSPGAPAATPAATGPAVTRRPKSGEVEVCGHQPMARERLQDLHIASGAAQPLKPALLDVARELAAGDAMERAVAALLEHQINRGDAALPEPQRAQVVASALRSNDPGLWLLAWRLCGYGQEAGSASCSGMNLQGWIDRDPANGAPWLWLAQQAANAGQTQAVDEAMYRLSQSQVVDPHWSALSRLQAHPALAPKRGLPAMLVSDWLVGYQAASALPSYGVLTKYCAAPALADANRRQRCDAVARLMTTQGRTMVDFAIGHRLAQALGWDAQRLQALQDFRDAASLPEITMGDGSRSFEIGLQPASCAARGEWIAHNAEVASLGEIGLARQRIAASGRTLAALGVSAREKEARSRAEYAAFAAAAASAASQTSRP